MNLREYFSNIRGRGILATADSDGRVDAAIYSRPHVTDDGSIAFIMRERLTHSNLKENPYATYLFMEDGGSSLSGVRLFLTKKGEDSDPELIEAMSRRNLSPEEDRAAGPKHIVYFSLDRVLSLVGGDEIAMEII